MIGFQPEDLMQKIAKSIIWFYNSESFIVFFATNIPLHIFGLKARNKLAQWQRPEGATPWVNKNIYNNGVLKGQHKN